jgi:hypothetical protein
MTDDDGFLSRWSRRKAGLQRDVARPVPPAPPAVPAPLPTLEPSAAPGDAGAAALAAADGEQTAHRQTAPADPRPAAPGTAAPPVAPPATPAPSWDDVAELTPASDFSRFVRADVDPGVRNAALKKLFAAPEFNVMDGLDIYIDDYSRPSPLPASMLRKLVQAAQLGLIEPAAPAPAPAPGVGRGPDPGATSGTTPGAAPTRAEDAPAPPAGTADALPPAAPATAAARHPDRGPAAAPVAPAAAPPHHEDTDLRLQPDDAAGPSGAGEGSGAHTGRQR